MPRGPGYPRHIRELAVREYLEGRVTMPALAKELGCTPATISRWVEKAKRGGGGGTPAPAAIHAGPSNDDAYGVDGQTPYVPPAPTPLAQRVAALAPPPAPPEEPEPELDLSDSDVMIAELTLQYRAHLRTAKAAKSQNDVKAETTARSAAIKIMTEIRQLQAAARKEGGDALAITRDDVDAARLEIRRRLDEIAAARGETLMWELDGTPKLRNADASHVTRDGGPKKPGGR